MIAILDWGIGGLGLYAELRRRAPEIDLFYLSDAGAPPYGTLSRTDLAARLATLLRFLLGRDAMHVVVACNAASTVLEDLPEELNRIVTGVIDAGVAAALASEGVNVGVIGGTRTIRSGIYQRCLRENGIRSRGRIAQPLSGVIERGEIGGEEFDSLLRKILLPLHGVDRLLLACTHYAAASKEIAAVLPGVQLIDPIPRLATTLLAERSGAGSREGTFMTTGDPELMRISGARAFGVKIDLIEKAELRS